MPQNPEAGDGEKSAVQSRCDVIHTLTLCEMSHFHDQRRHDFKLYMENFLQAQIEFHEAVGRGEGRGGGCASPIDVSPNPRSRLRPSCALPRTTSRSCTDAECNPRQRLGGRAG